MIGTSQLINAFGAPVCFTDTTDIFKDRSGVALYGLDYDASDAGGASGKFGEAAIFNGSSSYIDVSSLISLFNLKATATVSLWFNTSTTATTSVLFSDYAGNSARNFLVSINSTGNIVWNTRYGSGGGRDSNITTTSTYNDGNWHHIVLSIDQAANAKSMYVDGLQIGSSIALPTATGESFDSTQRVTMGSSYNTGNAAYQDYYNGKIDQVRIFDSVALTQSQVTQLYQENNSTVGTHLFGCIANYNLNGSAKESLGTTAYDGTETDITYRYDGTPTDVDFGYEGKSNYGAGFNGSSSKIDTGDSIISTGAFSASFWTKLDTLPSASSPAFISNISNTGNVGFEVRINYITDKVDFFFGAGLVTVNSNSALVANTWYHIACTYDGTNLKMYIDGNLQTQTSTGTLSAATNNLHIGKSAAFARYIDGSIDQVRIFNKAISAAEVSKLYGNSKGEVACEITSTTDSSNIGGTNQAYYKFDNDVLDYSGNNNDGTSSSMQFAFGRFGQAAIGDNSTRNFVNPQPFNTGDTISFWTRRRTASGGSDMIFGQHDGTYDFFTCQVYYHSDNTHKIQFNVRNSTSAYRYTQTGYTPDNGNWSHWVVTFNSVSSNPTVYLNTEEQSVSVSNSSGSMSSYAQSNARIGRGYINGSTYNMNGYLDQMRTFTSARTVEQITELYNEKQFLTLDTITEPTGNLRFDEFWASYDDGQTNRAEFKSGGQIVDFNTYSEGHAVLNQNAQTSGKYYLEIQLLGIQATEAEFVGVFNRSSNTVYDSPGYFSKNPVDGNYGAGISHEGSLVRIGNSQETGFTDLNIGVNDIYCLAVDVDDKRIWFGRRDGLSGNSITWNKGNPNGLYGGLKVNFVPSDVIVAHLSETYQRYAEFKVLDHADMLEPPFNFSYLNGAFTPSLTENESAH